MAKSKHDVLVSTRSGCIMDSIHPSKWPYVIQAALESSAYDDGRRPFTSWAKGFLGYGEALKLHTNGKLKQIYDEVRDERNDC